MSNVWPDGESLGALKAENRKLRRLLAKAVNLAEKLIDQVNRERLAQAVKEYKRPRGRPRKHSLPQPSKGRGRPAQYTPDFDRLFLEVAEHLRTELKQQNPQAKRITDKKVAEQLLLLFEKGGAPHYRGTEREKHTGQIRTQLSLARKRQSSNPTLTAATDMIVI